MGSVGVSRYLLLSSFCIAPLFPISSQCQTTVGIQPFGTYTTGLDQISVGDLGIHIEIPLYSRAERGLQTGFGLRLIYNGGTEGQNGFNSNWSYSNFSASFGSVQVATNSSPTQKGGCGDPGITYSYAYIDPTGFGHGFKGGSSNPDGCSVTSFGLPAAAYDGSGYLLTSANEYNATVVAPSGTTVVTNFGQVGGITDSNGNSFSECDVFLCNSANIYLTSTSAATATSSTYSYKDATGNPQTVTINNKNYPMYVPAIFNTNQQPSTKQVSYIDSVVYPDGTAYRFGYEQAADNPGFYTGRLASIQVPTGGTISYGYVGGQAGTQPYSNLGYVKTLTRTTQDGQTVYNRQVNSFGQPGSNSGGLVATSTTTVTTPDSTVVHMFVGGGENYGDQLGGLYEVSLATYPGSATTGTPLKQVTTCYAGATGDCTMQPFSFLLPLAMTSASTSLDGGPSSKIVNMFNAMSLPTETDVYDFGASVATTKTITTYAALGNNISDRPSSITVQDGSGNQISQTTYGYDELPLATSSATNLTAVSGARGNRTSQHDWVNTSPSTTRDTYRTYDTAGQVVSTKDPLGNVTQYAYDSTNDFCLNTTTYPALPSGITPSTSQTCDPNTGLVATTTDFNKATTTYSYDSMLRMAGVSVAGSDNALVSKVAYVYSGSTLPETITQTVSATPDPDQVTTTTLDGLGRPTTVVGANGASTATTYDALGRVQSVSTPYFSTSDPTYGITSYLYDALGRTTNQCQPDNAVQPSVTCVPAKSFQTWKYTGNVTLSTDENGHQRQRTSDALGRLTSVLEPDPTSGTLAFETDYTYDQLNNLTRVDQWGGPKGSAGDRVRHFGYDSLSRLFSSTNPETGLIGYSYDGNSNIHTRTDSRSVTTTYSYDPLNRLTGKSYTNDPSNTPPVNYVYDVAQTGWNFINQTSPAWPGVKQTNLIGRLSYAASGSAAIVYGYDALGRTTLKSVCTPTTCGTDHYDMHAKYDLAGNTIFSDLGLDAVQNAASPNAGYYYGGLQVAYNSAGQAVSGTADIVDATHPAAIVSGLQYSPLGGMTTAAFGSAYTESNQYSSRGWLTSRTGTIPSIGYSRVGALMHDPVGNVSQLTDSFSNATSLYGTDQLNRLISYSGPFGAATYGYDAWGNLVSHTNTAGSGYTYSLALTPQNQVSQTGSSDSSFTYDAAGNVQTDGLNNYSYDAEGRIALVNGSTAYLYGPGGERVATVQGGAVTAEYLYGMDGTLTTELAPGGKFVRGLVYGAGMHLADYTQNGKTVFHLADEVGSLVNTIDQTGAPIESCAANPFGESLNCSPSVDYTENHFTDKKRDGESGLDYLGARYYSSTFGRFMSPDYSDSGSAPDPVPYADLSNPQSLNLYSYAYNNPLTSTDADGHLPCGGTSSINIIISSDGSSSSSQTPDCDMSTSSNFGSLIEFTQGATNLVSQALQQVANIMTTPGGSGCMANAIGSGASVGAAAGGELGLVGLAGGGVGVVATEPVGLVVGGVGGGAAGFAASMSGCPGGAAFSMSGSEGGGGGGLSPSAKSKLGNLASRAGEKVRDVIRSRGGSGANVKRVGPWADRTLGEAADAAVKGDANAATAVKVAKDAARLGQKY